MLNFNDYINHYPFPPDKYMFYFYKNGETVFSTIDINESLEYSRNNPKVLYEKIKLDNEEVNTIRQLYRDEETRIYKQFKKDLFEEFEVSKFPRAEKVFEKAWCRGHDYGYEEVYIIFKNLVEIIQ